MKSNHSNAVTFTGDQKMMVRFYPLLTPVFVSDNGDTGTFLPLLILIGQWNVTLTGMMMKTWLYSSESNTMDMFTPWTVNAEKMPLMETGP